MLDPEEPEAAAILLGDMAFGISILFKLENADRETEKLRSIVVSHPDLERRASLLAQMVIGLKAYSRRVNNSDRFLSKAEYILDLLPPHHAGGHLSLYEALRCLRAFVKERRDKVEVLAKRIVESMKPLPADEAKGMRAWLESNLAALTNIDELTRCVPCQKVR